MSKHSKSAARINSGIVEVKSKFDAEFRRFGISRDIPKKFDDFQTLVEVLHGLQAIPFIVCYTDKDGDLLPINNDDNYLVALSNSKPLLRLVVQRKDQGPPEINGLSTLQKKKGPLSKLIGSETRPRPHIAISLPEDFRRVSAIIDVDVVPETHRRVKLMKNGSEKPLGFYIRDGTSVRVTSHGLEKVPGIFISRLVPGGLAESTGLVAVNDEVLEVNGIEVAGKTLDQVTDMMVANSSNLIITVKPVNQRNNISPRRGGPVRQSQKSTGSLQSAQSGLSCDSDEIREFHPEGDEDEVKNFLEGDQSTSSANQSTKETSSVHSQHSSSKGEDEETEDTEEKTDTEPILSL